MPSAEFTLEMMMAEMNASFSALEVFEYELYNASDVEKIHRLGKGGFCDVYLVNIKKAAHQQHLQQVAMKELHSDHQNQREFYEAANDLIHEAQILQQVNHPNIISLRGISDLNPNTFVEHGNRHSFDGSYFILLDVMLETLEARLDRWYRDDAMWQRKAFSRLTFRKGALRRLPKQVCQQKMMERIRTVVYDVAEAMDYLHENNIIFQDLKPENIGFEIETDELKIFDFGMARSVCPHTDKILGEEEEMICGTPRYMAPEVFEFAGGSKATDVYSFGIMMHEICSLNLPFNDLETFEEFRDHVGAGGRPNMLEIPDFATRLLIQDCVAEDPSQRPTFRELRDHRIPELLVQKKRTSASSWKSPSSKLDCSMRSETDVGSANGSGVSYSKRLSQSTNGHIMDDFDDDNDIEEYCLPPDLIRKRSSNLSMPRIHQSDDERSVNSRGLCGRSVSSANSDFFPSSEFMLAEDTNTATTTTTTQPLDCSLTKKKSPSKGKHKGVETPKASNQVEKEEPFLVPQSNRSLSLIGAQQQHQQPQPREEDTSRSSIYSETIVFEKESSIPRNLACDDSAAIAYDDPSITSRVSDDDDYAVTTNPSSSSSLPPQIPLPPPPPPPLPQQSPQLVGLDQSSHKKKKTKAKKKKTLLDSSAHSSVYTTDGTGDEPSTASKTKKKKKTKTKKGLDSSAHGGSVYTAGDDPSITSRNSDDCLLDGSTHSSSTLRSSKQRKRKKRISKKKDIVSDCITSSSDNKQTPKSPGRQMTCKSPKRKLKSPRGKSRKTTNKLAQPPLLSSAPPPPSDNLLLSDDGDDKKSGDATDDDNDDVVPSLEQTTDAMKKKNSERDASSSSSSNNNGDNDNNNKREPPPRQFSWWNLDPVSC